MRETTLEQLTTIQFRFLTRLVKGIIIVNQKIHTIAVKYLKARYTYICINVCMYVYVRV